MSDQLIAFDKATLDKKTLVLSVTGKTANSNVHVTLRPVYYIHQPEYWKIYVLGEQKSPFLTMVTPYTVRLDVSTTIGTKGIAVIGKHKARKLLGSTRGFGECQVYCPECEEVLSNCMRDRAELGRIKGEHNIEKHDYQPVAQIYVCGSTTKICDTR